MTINRQRVFITGASSGLGAALARQYAAQGAILGLVARRSEVLQELQAGLPNAADHQVYALDVNDHAALAQAAADFIRHAQGIDIVIANAGISRGTLTEYAEDLQVFEQVFATNVTATVATFSPFIPTMLAQAAAGHTACRLVGIGSVAGIRGLPGAGAYSASKSAVISYCESLGVELKKSGIKVVTIAPGYIDTPMTQGRRFPMPFLLTVEEGARRIVDGFERGGFEITFPRRLAWLLKAARMLPYPAYFALMSRFAGKGD
mgnify:CR=1 FL=1